MAKRLRIIFFIAHITGIILGSVINTFALTTEEEKKLGKEFLSKVKQQFELLEEPYPLVFLYELNNLLYLKESNKPFDISIYLIKKSDMNAFAGPGGNLFFFTGLFERLERVDELAGVLSHELAHVSFRHLSSRIAQSYKAGLATIGGMLLGALVGGAPGEAIIAGSMAAGVQMQLAYSREDERQADQLGLKYMIDAGFDPYAILELHQELQRQSYFAGNKIPPYLLTHPTSAERMANLEAMIRDARPNKDTAKAMELRRLYPFIRAVVIGYTKETEEVFSYFEGMKKRFPNRPEYLLGSAISKLRDRDFKSAKKDLLTAVELAPNVSIIKTYLAKVFLEEGDPEKAKGYLKEVLLLNDEDVYANYIMAESLLDSGDPEGALVYLKRLSYLEAKAPYVNPDIYYKMGTILGKQGNADLAHYNLGIYYKKTDEPKKASFHFNKALSLTKDEKLRAEIQELLKEKKTPN